MSAAHVLPIIGAGVLAFTILAYIVLDGFDLGLGILFLVERETRDRDIMVNTVAPVWDGNETWLVLGGACLYGVFPIAYGTILPALYPPIIAMLLALIFRGVAFEFRFKTRTARERARWDFAFLAGSLVAAAMQGLILGTLIQGIRVVNNQYAGGWFDWLTGFSLFCALAVVIGYALLGACWLIWRTEDGLQARARRYAEPLAVLTILMIVAVSLWTPELQRQYLTRWFVWPRMIYVAPVPLLTGALIVVFWRSVAREAAQLTPLLCVLGWFFLCFSGLCISIWPWIVPPAIDLWQASSPPSSQLFLLAGALVLIPTVLAYTGYAYWVFRGKVKGGDHYH